jgi:hypothetical protein
MVFKSNDAFTLYCNMCLDPWRNIFGPCFGVKITFQSLNILKVKLILMIIECVIEISFNCVYVAIGFDLNDFHLLIKCKSMCVSRDNVLSLIKCTIKFHQIVFFVVDESVKKCVFWESNIDFNHMWKSKLIS